MRSPSSVVFFIDGTLANARVVSVLRVVDEDHLELDMGKDGKLVAERAVRNPRPALSWDYIA